MLTTLTGVCTGSSLSSLLPWHTWPSLATGEKQPCASPVLPPGLLPRWAPTPAPPPPCIHALICSPAGDTTSQGCSQGVPCTVGKGSSAFCPRLPGLCEGPEACLLPFLCQLHSSATRPPASLALGRFTRTLDMPRPSTRQLWRARFARWATRDGWASQTKARTPVPLFARSLVLTHSGIKQPQADNVNTRSDAQGGDC